MQPAEASTMPANPHAGMGMDMAGAPAQPQLKWTLPSGWKEKPLSEMRAGSFEAAGKDGQSADVQLSHCPRADRKWNSPI